MCWFFKNVYHLLLIQLTQTLPPEVNMEHCLEYKTPHKHQQRPLTWLALGALGWSLHKATVNSHSSAHHSTNSQVFKKLYTLSFVKPLHFKRNFCPVSEGKIVAQRRVCLAPRPPHPLPPQCWGTVGTARSEKQELASHWKAFWSPAVYRCTGKMVCSYVGASRFYHKSEFKLRLDVELLKINLRCNKLKP